MNHQSIRLRPTSGATPGFVKPFLDALTQIHESEQSGPEELRRRAEQCLSTLVPDEAGESCSAFSRAAIGLQADHTHYFDGFGLMLPLRRGMAVASAPGAGSTSRLLVEGDDEAQRFSFHSDGTERESDTILLLKHVALQFGDDLPAAVDFALVSDVPGGLDPVFAASFAIAVHRSLEGITGLRIADESRIRRCTAAIQSFYGHPFSPAFLRAANLVEFHSFVLVDTHSLSFVPLDFSENESPAWGLIDCSAGEPVQLPKDRFTAVDAITEKLGSKHFRDLQSLRDLEHRDLERAEKIVSRRHRGTLRLLVSENRRVQQLVTAIRKQDWQLCGTIMMIAHGARKQLWNATTTMQDEVVSFTERFSDKGVYGATQTGESGFVLVTGQPFSLPGFLDSVREESFTSDDRRAQTIII